MDGDAATAATERPQVSKWAWLFKNRKDVQVSEQKRGIVFDVDGTLWDSCAVVAESWNEWLRANAPEVDPVLTGADMRRVMGLTMTKIGDALFAGLPDERRCAVTEGCCEFEVEYLQDHSGSVYEGVRETLLALKEIAPLYIVSNCQKGYIEVVIKWCGIEDLISDYESFGGTGLLKADNLKLLAERNGLDEAVYIGDTMGDLDSAKEAGMPFIHAAYGFGKMEDPAVPAVQDIRELPDLITRMFCGLRGRSRE